MDFGGAFSKAMTAGAGLIDRAIQKDDQIEAEQRAADLRVSLEERLSAIREASDKRAAEYRETLRKQGRISDFEFDTNPENVKAKATAETTVMETTAPVKARLEREAATEKLKAESTPEALAAKRKIALASHIESASSIAAANLSKFQLGQLQQAADLEKEYRAAVDAGDEQEAAKAARKIAGAKVDKKDAGDYLRAATNTLKMVEKAETTEEATELKNMASLLFKLGGVDPARAVAAGKPAAGAPYAEGTKLKGKDGKAYVVRNGVPVLDTPKGGLIDQ